MMGFFAILVGSTVGAIAFALVVMSPLERNELVRFPETRPTAPLTTVFRPTTSATTFSTTSTTGTTLPTTTPVPILPVNITCPSDIVIVLGTDLEPVNTGGRAVAEGGCTVPVVQYADVFQGFIGNKKKSVEFGVQEAPKWFPSGPHGEQVPVDVMGGDMMPDLMPLPPDLLVVDMHETGNSKKRLASPSFDQTNVIHPGTPLSIQNTGSPQPSPSIAVGPTSIVTLINDINGAVVIVSDLNRVVQANYMLGSLGMGNCSTGSARGQGQVLWDFEAQRWVLLELGADDALCLYVSNSSDPLGGFSSFIYYFAPHTPQLPKLGLWRQAYLLTAYLEPVPGSLNPRDLCVLDREALLNYAQGAPVPNMTCAPSLLGRLSGFTTQRWTPASVAAGGPMPTAEIESASGLGVGALFFRHVDDELHGGMTTPTTDFIEVEHWASINFNTGTYNALRYKINVADFDSSFGACVSSDECIPTPMGQQLDPHRYDLSISYRDGSILCAFTSRANGVGEARVEWMELKWSRALLTNPFSWRAFQHGQVQIAGRHLWLPSITSDANGTIAIAHQQSSASVFPSLYVSTRLQNDPNGATRIPLLLAPGAVGSVLAMGAKQWGINSAVSACPAMSRTFYVAGQVSDDTNPWVAKLTQVYILGETIQRTWRADDYCGDSATCVQMITTI
jgi:hypothetical protein